MSTLPSRVRVKGAGARAPVAGPPERTAGVPPLPVPIAPPEWDWWTPGAIRGWAASVLLHAILLVSLACWYFAPRTNRPIAFDTRLAGSPNGVREGEMLTGGLNTPVEMASAPLAQTDLAQDSASLTQLEFSQLEPEARFRGARTPSAGGGAPNNNPGAGDGDGFGLARFGEGGELVRGVAVKVGDPQFTLIWNTDGVDLDLHVIEPGGKEIYWESPKGEHGGELDVDNTKGFGPENVYWLVESEGPGSKKVRGPGPSGTYRWFVVYWGGFGGLAKPTHWQVRVKHKGQVKVYDGKFRALNERSKVYTLKVEAPPAAAATPDSSAAGSR
jgi:hypothetical protein